MEIKLYSPKYGEKIVFVDPEDFDAVSQLHWCVAFVRGNWYATRTFWENGKCKTLKMHRFILGLTDSSVKVDHKNHYGLDNRKDNLRVATIAQNTRNVGVNKTNTTGYKGVFKYKLKKTRPYTAALKFNGTRIFGGYFDTAEDAAKKYNELAIKYHGEFAHLNEIR